MNRDRDTGTGSSILMVVGLFHPVVGGAEKVCQRLAQRFIAQGISVTVLTQYCAGLPERPGNPLFVAGCLPAAGFRC